MQRFTWISLIAIALIATAGSVAGHEHEHEHEGEMPDQQAMMEAWMKAGAPGEHHAKMAEHAGKWKATVKVWMQPGGEPQVSDGKFERELTLDGRVLQEKFEGSFAGQPFVGHGRTGYDNVTGRWWSTWTDSMSTGLMVMYGDWSDEEGGVVYTGKQADPMTGGMVDVKSIVRHPKDGHEVLEMYNVQGGELVQTMEITSTRR